MRRALAPLVLALLALPWTLLAFAVMVGAGLLRRGGPVLVALSALALVFVPPVAAGALVRRGRLLAILPAATLWSLGLLAAFPLYFPGERGDALSTGLAVFGANAGAAVAARAARLMELERAFPSLGDSRPPPPPARAVEIEPADTSGRDETEIETSAEGRSITVPVRMEGVDGRAVAVRLIFDTGATLTTLDHRTLERLGVTVDASAPRATLRTASGRIEAELAILRRVWLNGVEVPAVTVALCDECAGESSVGLLGLNVSAQFVTSLDALNNRLVLHRRAGEANRVLDVGPWLTIGAKATRWLDGRIEVSVEVENASPRLVRVAEVGIRCDRTYIAELRDVPPRGKGAAVVTLPRGASCDDYTAPLERATW